MAEPRRFSAEDFRRRVAERLLREIGPAVGDHSFNPELADALLEIARQPAAVLVPVIHREPEATLLFTERTGGLRAHAGQIAFPGGRSTRAMQARRMQHFARPARRSASNRNSLRRSAAAPTT